MPPITSKYRKPIFEAIGLQIVVGFLSLLILDGGTIARICGIALMAFWIGAVVLIWRRPNSPTPADIELLRFGYLPVIFIAYFFVRFISTIKGIQ